MERRHCARVMNAYQAQRRDWRSGRHLPVVAFMKAFAGYLKARATIGNKTQDQCLCSFESAFLSQQQQSIAYAALETKSSASTAVTIFFI